MAARFDAKQVEQDVFLLSQLDGNGACVDCPDQSTGWVDLDHRVFSCARCGGLHQRLGFSTKIIGSHTFSEEDLARLLSGGNAACNAALEANLPANAAALRADIGEFIKQKYLDLNWAEDAFKPSKPSAPPKPAKPSSMTPAVADFIFASPAETETDPVAGTYGASLSGGGFDAFPCATTTNNATDDASFNPGYGGDITDSGVPPFNIQAAVRPNADSAAGDFLRTYLLKPVFVQVLQELQVRSLEDVCELSDTALLAACDGLCDHDRAALLGVLENVRAVRSAGTTFELGGPLAAVDFSPLLMPARDGLPDVEATEKIALDLVECAPYVPSGPSEELLRSLMGQLTEMQPNGTPPKTSLPDKWASKDDLLLVEMELQSLMKGTSLYDWEHLGDLPLRIVEGEGVTASGEEASERAVEPTSEVSADGPTLTPSEPPQTLPTAVLALPSEPFPAPAVGLDQVVPPRPPVA